MNKKISYLVKQKLIELSATCFWFWNNFYVFLESSGVPKKLLDRYPQSVFSKFQVMKNVLDYLEEEQLLDVIDNLISNFYKMNFAVDKGYGNDVKAQDLLNEFKIIVGNDPLEKALQKKEIERKKQETQRTNEEKKHKDQKFQVIYNRFSTLMGSKNLQERGYQLEKLFFDILAFEELNYSQSYRTSSEQIDGFFQYEKFDYLVEIKWINTSIKQSDLSIFDGKIRGKAQSTRGLFFAINGFDQSCVQKFSGDTPRIILMDGQDFMYILERRISFYDCMKSKVDALVRYGNIYFKCL